MLSFLKAAGIVLLMASLLFGVLAWNFEQPPYAYYRIQRFNNGASQTEVLEALGTPSSIQSHGTRYAYSRPLSWGVLYVDFHEGTLVGYEYDR